MKAELLKLEELGETEDYESKLEQAGAHFVQSRIFELWQKSAGHRVRTFVIYQQNEAVLFFRLIVYPLWRKKTYLYLPHGPVLFKPIDKPITDFLFQSLSRLAKAERAVFVRFDPWPKDFWPTSSNQKFYQPPYLAYHFASGQPKYEWLVDLTEDENLLWQKLNRKQRYLIRWAEKQGVTIDIVDQGMDRYADDFFKLMKITATRNKFCPHPKEYYQQALAIAEKRGNSFLAIARYNNQIMAMGFIVCFAGVANYVFAASGNNQKNLRFADLIQWHSFKVAKQCGCHHYSFGGINGPKVYKPSWQGLTSFKQKFPGQMVEFADFYDVVNMPFWYYLYLIRKFLTQKS